MKILSIDVGIKNLALCLLEVKNNTYEIVKWDVINLCGAIPLCKEVVKTKTCNKVSKLYRSNRYYCKSCAKKTDFIIPSAKLNTVENKRIKIEELKTIAKEYEVTLGEKMKKQDIIDVLVDFKKKKCLENLQQISASDIPLVNIGVAIRENLGSSDYVNVDKILIENQISPIANRMKTVQGMLAQFFIMKGTEDIEFVSASNKLKFFMGKGKTTYNERKKAGIEITKNILNADKYTSHVEQISNSNKKDDLADCFLQGLWYILENNLATTEYKNHSSDT